MQVQFERSNQRAVNPVAVAPSMGIKQLIIEIALNYLTLGVYGAYRVMLTERTIFELQSKQRILDKTAKKLGNEWKQIEATIALITDPKHNWEEVLINIKNYGDTFQEHIHFKVKSSFSQDWTCKRCVRLAKLSFANLLSAGAASWRMQNNLSNKIKQMKSAYKEKKAKLRGKLKCKSDYVNNYTFACLSAVNKHLVKQVQKFKTEKQQQLTWLRTPIVSPGNSDGPVNVGHFQIHSIFREANSPKELIELSFRTFFEQLIDFTNMDPKHYRFTKNAEDSYQCPIRMAIYRFMALSFLNEGVIRQDGGCPGYFKLQLNENGLCMLPTRVRPILVADGNNSIKGTQFTYKDKFTPNDPTELPEGIQPVEAKRLLVQLSAAEQQLLFYRILKPIRIEDGRFENQSFDHLNRIYQLIDGMANAIRIKWEPDCLNFLWLELANEEVDDSLLPAEIHEMDLNKFWEPHAVLSNLDINGTFAKAIEQYRNIHAKISPEKLATPLNRPRTVLTLDSLKNVYHTAHYVYWEHGCLLSAIVTALMQDQNEVTPEAIQILRNSMAALLDDQTNASYYQNWIEKNHGLSIDEYKSWLRVCGEDESVRTADLGDLEIELAAVVLGIRINVFSKGSAMAVNPERLLTSLENVGPSTKEGLYLFFCETGDPTFYALFPKLRANPEDPEVTANLGYWENVGNRQPPIQSDDPFVAMLVYEEG